MAIRSIVFPLLLTAASSPLPTLAQERVPGGQAADFANEAQVRRGRVAALDDAGPELRAVIAVKDSDLLAREAAAAAALPLQGRTVLVKDNIETREWPTTAGSLALAGNMTRRDAPLITRLRAAGGVVMGKTNLSEWANIRSGKSTSGWSAVGGQTRNPHATDRNACGSSSGSGAAVAAGFAWAAIGTETDGSITCPASVNGIVGFKPTVGLVSRTHVVPISHSQDTAGPMTNSVADAALLLTAIAGSDAADPATADADAHKVDFLAALSGATLRGVRIGVLRKQIGENEQVSEVFEQALTDLRAAGAELVDVDYELPDELGEDEFTTLAYELREDLGTYLRGSTADIPVRSLADVIAFNDAHAEAELRWFGQETFRQAQEMDDSIVYGAAREDALRMAGEEGIDRLLLDHRVTLLIAPTVGPAWPIDLVGGDAYDGSIGAGTLPAVAGYPHLTVPMGAVEGLPVGLSFIGAKWQDTAVLRAGAAYESARTATLPKPTFKPWGNPQAFAAAR